MNFANLTIPIALGLAFVSSAVQTNYKPYPIERYQSIMERLPFGPLPANFTEDGEPPPDNVPEPVVTQTAEEIRKEQQELAKTVKMSCVNIAPGGDVMVGFTDSSENPPVNYYLAVGEGRKGWKVLDADYDKEWAQLVRDEVMITVKLGEGLIDAPAGSKGSGMTNQVATTSASKPISLQSSSSTSSTRLSVSSLIPRTTTAQPPAPIQPAASSFTARLAARREKEAAAEVAKEQAQKENLLKLVREATQQELEKQRQEEEETRAQEEAQQLQQQQVIPPENLE